VVLLSGKEHLQSIILLMLAGLVGAALVGQILVGKSDKLSRPYGYFGGLLGIITVGAVLSFYTDGILLVLAAFCFAGPWVQAVGRLRCIVQGCCHGMPAHRSQGIVVNNPHSRVCGLAGLGGIPIYPTQLYSILGNLFLGLLLWWFWRAEASMTLISGLYLTLAGAVRFVEEGYRGEPGTKIVAGFRVYQWFATLMYVAGMVVAMIPSLPVPPVDYFLLPVATLAGGAFFLVCGLALSVDFPESTARFSRLSG
jgi:prolipoprotein diacylglyceryltransferase